MIDNDYFKREEFACKCGCGFDAVDVELLDILTKIRTYFNAPVSITSGCRCESHNRAIGGSPTSQHKLGKAADIVVRGINPSEVYEYIDIILEGRGGAGLYEGWCHVDVRDNKARW